MNSNQKIGVVDIGNTSTKVAVFQKGEIILKSIFSKKEEKELSKFILTQTDKQVVASVRSEENTQKMIQSFNNIMILSNESPVPFQNNYKSKTLGMDRLCNAAFLSKNTQTEIGICIDIGTCLKFDVFQKGTGYLGGSISPGIRLRYQSLNDYTGKLPLLSNEEKIEILGNSTQSSIHSGVINGIQGEIEYFIRKYEALFSSLTFFVTGGNALNFDFTTKNNIFADENLTLKGLYEIYKHNA